jgi:hypothetical protein
MESDSNKQNDSRDANKETEEINATACFRIVYLSVFFIYMSRGSSINIVTELWVRFPAGAGIFSSRHRVQTGSGAHQSPIQWIPGAPSRGKTTGARK